VNERISVANKGMNKAAVRRERKLGIVLECVGEKLYDCRIGLVCLGAAIKFLCGGLIFILRRILFWGKPAFEFSITIY
jgi:hypothetical protein